MKPLKYNKINFWKWLFKLSFVVSSIIGFIFTLLFFFRFVILPTFFIQKQNNDNISSFDFNIPFIHIDDINMDIIIGVKELYMRILDSLEHSEYDRYLFALGVTKGEIRFFPVKDSLGVIIQFNFECGCALNDSIIACVLMPIDLRRMEQTNKLYLDHVPKRIYPTSISKENIISNKNISVPSWNLKTNN